MIASIIDVTRELVTQRWQFGKLSVARYERRILPCKET